MVTFPYSFFWPMDADKKKNKKGNGKEKREGRLGHHHSIEKEKKRREKTSFPGP